MKNHNYIVVMAGGSGTRLWPKSRENHPKQLHKLVSKKSLIQDTIEDTKNVVDKKNVLIVTGKRYLNPIKKQLPYVKKYLLEPYKLGKTLAIGLAALYLYKINPKSVMILLWSDSYIGDKKQFEKVLKQSVSHASKGQNIIIGVKPYYPATCYGYIQTGKKIQNNLYHIDSFVEKPDEKTAKKYLKSGKYFWSPGISIWRVDKLLELYKKYIPKYFDAIMQFEGDIHDINVVDKFAKAYKDIVKTEIEETIYPKAKNLAVLTADIQWNDIGNWDAIHQILSKNDDTNIYYGNHISVDNQGCLIYAHDKLVSTIGLKNIAVIDTDDAILICDKKRSQDVKKIIEKMQSDKKYHRYL